jgi:hypothetical protein
MLIYGGVSNSGKYLNDLCFYYIDINKWQIVTQENNMDPDGIAFHKMCAVFKGEVKNAILSEKLEYRINKNESLNTVMEEGLYVFGGKDKYGRCHTNLRVLKLGFKTFLKW